MRLPATRSGLLRGRQELARVDRGIALVRRKREALVAELFRQARPAADARQAVDAQAARAWSPLLDALAVHGADALRALSRSGRTITTELRAVRVWGVAASELAAPVSVHRTLDARGMAAAGIGPAPIVAAEEFERLAELLLNVAAREQLLRRLGEAVARSSRLLRTLETKVAPLLTTDLAAIRRTLDEREREEQHRLRRFSGG